MSAVNDTQICNLFQISFLKFWKEEVIAVPKELSGRL